MSRVPIIAIQRRLHETGRIRIGQQVAVGDKGRTRPAKLESFRLTSANREALDTVASLYGGDVHDWAEAPVAGQFELFTESYSLKVVVPPEQMAFSQYYELWSGGGCKRRCDGEHQIPGGEDCVCDEETTDPDELCGLHTRLSVILVDVPGTGLWRLDTKGWNAASELAGAFELAKIISGSSRRSLLPGALRLDQRKVKRPGQPTRQFAVPVLDFAVDLEALDAGPSRALPAGSGVTPIPGGDEAPTLGEALADVEEPGERPRRANAAEPVRPTGVAPRPRLASDEPGEEEPEPRDPGEEPTAPAPAPDAVVSDWSEALRAGIASVPEGFTGTLATSWKDRELPPVERLRGREQFEAAAKLVEFMGGTVTFPDTEPPALKVVVPDEVIDPGVRNGMESEDVGVEPTSLEDVQRDTPGDAITDAKVRQIQIRFRELDPPVNDREERLAYLRAVCKREEISSTKDLTLAEAAKVLDQLRADAEEDEHERVGRESGGEPF